MERKWQLMSLVKMERKWQLMFQKIIFFKNAHHITAHLICNYTK
jgi:hypothetical protein